MGLIENIEEYLQSKGFAKLTKKEYKDTNLPYVYTTRVPYTNVFGISCESPFIIKTPTIEFRLTCSGFYKNGGSCQDKVLDMFLSAKYCYDELAIIMLDGVGYPQYVKDTLKKWIDTDCLSNKKGKNTVYYMDLPEFKSYIERIVK